MDAAKSRSSSDELGSLKIGETMRTYLMPSTARKGTLVGRAADGRLILFPEDMQDRNIWTKCKDGDIIECQITVTAPRFYMAKALGIAKMAPPLVATGILIAEPEPFQGEELLHLTMHGDQRYGFTLPKSFGSKAAPHHKKLFKVRWEPA